MSQPFRPRPLYAVLIVVLLSATACTALPPLMAGPEPTPVAGAAPAAPLTTETRSEPTPAPATAVISGQVTYRERIALQNDAIVEVELQDVSRAGAPALIVGWQRIETQGKQVPIPFAIEYNPAAINPANMYNLRARIIEGGLVTWLTTDAPIVLTRGGARDRVEVQVTRSENPQPVQAPAGRLEGTVTYSQRIALAPDAVIEVSLQDISRADAPADVVARQTIQANGKQVPIPFALLYDAAQIKPAARYSVSARITENGKLTWISTQLIPVLTDGAPASNVEIVVQPVKGN
ncbi:MAG: YbaY family lipoprotein [Nitrososphaerales archaeon]